MKTPLTITGKLPQALDVLGADGKPLANRQLVLKWGDNATTKGLVRVGPRTKAVLPSLQKRLGLDKVQLDYNHNTCPGTPAYKEAPDPRPVAAYGEMEVVEGEGLYLTNIEFNDHGKENAKHFKDLSAVVLQDKDSGEVLACTSVALCRQGAADGIEVQTVALSIDLPEAEEAGVQLSLLALAADDEVIRVLGDKLREQEWVSRALADGEQGMRRLVAENTALRSVADALTASYAAIKAELDALRASLVQPAQVTALSTEVDGKLAELARDFAAKLSAQEKTTLLREAARVGKVVALGADALEKLSATDLAEHIARLKPTMPVGRVTALHIVEPGAEGEAATGLEAEIRRNCGLSPKK